MKASVEQTYRLMQTLGSGDIAAAIRFALEQPEHVDVNEILIRPTEQER
jgi:NADP-dependent 3-hydroxy acid dehydrogenase YdfG